MNNIRLIPIVILLLTTNGLYAQHAISVDSIIPDPQAEIANLLYHLDRSQLDPPNLWDEGYDLINVALFDGQDHADVIADPRIFGLAYGSIMTMPTDAANSLPDPLAAYSTETLNLSSSDAMPIMSSSTPSTVSSLVQ